uniref:DAC domain-containing protein n=1 Tax=Chromera velia CCMP2878 TaxID=1169474 RepID=A0A0G4HII4_9ALVE|eukprot:Cvel_6952.t1-p1 / transcript=Cvel_6952.t1 / gene=Cvel_6952 / organism=Chromera_velia_CCMP2878 / gene_product=hypothetical protein / transcript_product=hypothetical protein / location=Cvel_scaffold352:73715-76717(-) / protein_length=630 / sequence_SO=supercontig / SO=protein_coding / is_pseudo=false
MEGTRMPRSAGPGVLQHVQTAVESVQVPGDGRIQNDFGSEDGKPEVHQATLNYLFDYAVCGYEGHRSGCSFLLGLEEKINDLGWVSGINAVEAVSKFVHRPVDRKQFRPLLNGDGIKVVCGLTGRFLKTSFIVPVSAPADPNAAGMARTHSCESVSKAYPEGVVLMVSQDSQGEVVEFKNGARTERVRPPLEESQEAQLRREIEELEALREYERKRMELSKKKEAVLKSEIEEKQKKLQDLLGDLPTEMEAETLLQEYHRLVAEQQEKESAISELQKDCQRKERQMESLKSMLKEKFPQTEEAVRRIEPPRSGRGLGLSSEVVQPEGAAGANGNSQKKSVARTEEKAQSYAGIRRKLVRSRSFPRTVRDSCAEVLLRHEMHERIQELLGLFRQLQDIAASPDALMAYSHALSALPAVSFDKDSHLGVPLVDELHHLIKTRAFDESSLARLDLGSPRKSRSPAGFFGSAQLLCGERPYASALEPSLGTLCKSLSDPLTIDWAHLWEKGIKVYDSQKCGSDLEGLVLNLRPRLRCADRWILKRMDKRQGLKKRKDFEESLRFWVERGFGDNIAKHPQFYDATLRTVKDVKGQEEYERRRAAEEKPQAEGNEKEYGGLEEHPEGEIDENIIYG